MQLCCNLPATSAEHQATTASGPVYARHLAAWCLSLWHEDAAQMALLLACRCVAGCSTLKYDTDCLASMRHLAVCLSVFADVLCQFCVVRCSSRPLANPSHKTESSLLEAALSHSAVPVIGLAFTIRSSFCAYYNAQTGKHRCQTSTAQANHV